MMNQKDMLLIIQLLENQAKQHPEKNVRDELYFQLYHLKKFLKENW
ncbi:hypothetical protein ACFVR2_02020 [Gottfriedia sp. NPDC057991]